MNFQSEFSVGQPEKLACLEGLRGVASLAVLFHHLFFGFLPALIWGAAGSKGHIWPDLEVAMAQSPLNIFWSGDFAVMIFFVLSGFVLTHRFFRDYDYAAGRPLLDEPRFLATSVMRRYPRLVLPIFASSVLTLVFYKANWLWHVPAAQHSLSHEWLALLWNLPDPTLSDVLRNSFLEVPFKEATRYNNVLWTIYIEFYGSMLCFALLALTGRQPWRWAAYPLLLVWLGNSPYVAFVLGVLLADMRYAPCCRGLRQLLRRPAIHWPLALAGLYLGSFPKGIPTTDSLWYAWLNILDGGALPNAQWAHNWGALLIMIGVLYSAGWQKAFAAPVCVALGRISFAMYLLHGLILGSLTAGLVTFLTPKLGYAPTLALCLPVSVAAVFAASSLFARYVDEPSVRIGRQACGRLWSWIAEGTNAFSREEWIIAASAILFLYVFLYAALKQPWLSHNAWDSYALQAKAWWEGHIALDKNYSYLELAEFKHRFFVSFPPIPAIPQFILFPLFGENTPNNLLVSAYGITGFVVAALLSNATRGWKCMALPCAAVFGSNLLTLSVCGGVWFQAQLLAFLLTSLAFLLAVREPRSGFQTHLGFLALALAVGCRPFQIVYFPVLLLLLAQSRENWTYREAENGTTSAGSSLASLALADLRFLLLPVLVGCAFGWYNWVRFENPLEFGHSYLPEFQAAPLGQFNLGYIPENVANSFRLPQFTPEGGLTFPRFNGMLFFLANPIYLIFFAKLREWKPQQTSLNVLLLVSVVLHILLICSHRTMGGWQFGNRYFTDMIPALLLFMRVNRVSTQTSDVIICLGGLLLNVYGALWLLLNWP